MVKKNTTDPMIDTERAYPKCVVRIPEMIGPSSSPRNVPAEYLCYKWMFYKADDIFAHYSGYLGNYLRRIVFITGILNTIL
jgi:hypothetical protein